MPNHYAPAMTLLLTYHFPIHGSNNANETPCRQQSGILLLFILFFAASDRKLNAE
ncbi:MAG TPA: hypothetical protein VK470_08565 [Bacteroidota bacterium]|nr:hypothetical protein [Bacteroidota bacterium]